MLCLEQEDAFWCLVAIVEVFMPRDYYTKTLLGSQVRVCARACPATAACVLLDTGRGLRVGSPVTRSPQVAVAPGGTREDGRGGLGGQSPPRWR